MFHRGSAANYKRIIYVKTMEFKDVTIMDKVRISGQYRLLAQKAVISLLSKTDALFSTQYSDPVDLLSQHLVRRLERLQEQVEFARDNPGPKADLVVDVVREADFVK